jgi:hypothetical protein|tara:strand:+ start:24 stop:701 length:678 start_codon:yes stop_codon:yes gene_type:complete
MFGKKKKDASNEDIIDETIADKSKFVTVGFGALVASVFLFIILEIYTSVKISTQKIVLKKDGGAEEKSREILMQIALKGKNVKDLEYEYIKEIMKFMSPTEFQEFKNNISALASPLNVQINSLNEIESEKLDIYEIYAIEYEFLSKYENFVQLKNKLSEINFKINLVEETIERYSPESDKILANGIIHAYVFKDKDDLLKKNEKLIEQQKILEEKEAEKKASSKN